MIIYFFCPFYKTGGPENIHLTSSIINTLYKDKAESHIIYNENLQFNLYPEIDNIIVKQLSDFVDDENNVVIIPEIVNVDEFVKSRNITKCKVVIWWLSFVNASLKYTLHNMFNKNIHHAFHSYYEYAMIKPHVEENYSFLTDYLADCYLELNTEDFKSAKQPVVCFNGFKDKTTKKYCIKNGIPFIEIVNMNREQVNETLKKSMIYVDNGFHPGKDHLPREAALYGCIVITNKSGSAAYWEDVPILEKISFEDELNPLINKIVQNYELYYNAQQFYRERIRSEKSLAIKNIEDFINKMKV